MDSKQTTGTPELRKPGYRAWAALNEHGVPIAASLRRSKEECAHDSSISNPVPVMIFLIADTDPIDRELSRHNRRWWKMESAK